MARKAKELVKDHGILTMLNPKGGKVISEENLAIVRQFYLSAKISNYM